MTSDGRQVIPRLAALIALHEEIEQACLRIGADTAPTLSVASQRISLVAHLPAALRVLRGIVANLTVSTTHATDQRLLDLVSSGEADVGLGFRRTGTGSSNDALEEVAFERTPSMVFMPAGHRLAGNDRIKATDLADETLVSVYSRLATRATEAWVRDVPGISWVRADDPQVALSMVEQGVGVSVMIAAAAALGPESLVGVPVAENTMFDLTIIRRSGVELSPPAQILWDLMAEQAARAGHAGRVV